MSSEKAKGFFVGVKKKMEGNFYFGNLKDLFCFVGSDVLSHEYEPLFISKTFFFFFRCVWGEIIRSCYLIEKELILKGKA